MGGIGKIMIFIGSLFIIFGLLFLIFEKIHLPKMPFDIYIKKDNFQLFFPIGTSLIISLILTIILNILIIIFKK